MYLVLLVYSAHTFLALSLSNNFAGVLHNDLVRLKGAVTANAVSTIWGLDHLNTYVIFASGLGSLLELFEVPIATLRTYAADPVITFIKHVAVLTELIATGVWRAGTF
jgi:hypothetical protein